MAYIYMIKNDINDKKYIGKTTNTIEYRFKQHLNDAFKKVEEHRPLYSAIRKYGKEHFSIKEIEEILPEEASGREEYWISYYDTFHNGYNATKGGDGKSYLDYDKILDLYDNTNYSQAQIAKICNCTNDSVRKVVEQYRDNVDWIKRYSQNHCKNNLGVIGLKVQCVETGEIFESCTQAGNWLVSQGKIKSSAYGRNAIAEVRRGKKKFVGGYSWKPID